ncbi:MAG: Mur ligase [Verrucomicrobia bacterium]|nr:MAG: Mur ligase [Verrucomicrobiota bacterium]
MRIYFLGIAGTAMGNAALLLRSLGHEVSGVDENVYPPMSDVLRKAGIVFREGYDAERLEECAPDLAVVGNVLSRGNPEIEWLLDSRRVVYDSLPAVLRRMVLGDRRNIVVAGTHGKTTTTALTAHLLRENGYDPGFLIGGVPLDPPMGTHPGRPDHPFVIEGDEYDSAFFDKRSKFIHYAPQVAVLNNLEFDHADIFRDLEDVKRTFSHFLRLVPRNGAVIVNGDDENLKELLPVPWTSVYRVGESEANDLRIESFSESADGSRFDLIWKNEHWASVAWKQHGFYNARNAAVAALAAALAVSPDRPSVLRVDGLASFRGVRRRHEVRFQSPNLTVIEDFGHHPTAIGETLKSLRNQYPEAYLMAAFEPRSNTARTRIFQEDLVPALSKADRAVIGPVNRADLLDPAVRLDTSSLVSQLALAGTRADACHSHDEAFRILRNEMETPRDRPVVVVLFSNGAFGGIIERLVRCKM